ncbi:hypothetical protein LWC35_02440 [Pseudonocardia kujensis]|uniref:hypothetical protein n=1 Tax=Pseudonocardia kujensis TaxID=1128675 RepID=UPI001E28B2E3|nr:hypothetical protein [Pseudonocardia kujensis]MCE0761778.1 hypothetical protein [Pseudonocardia kujensis]
MSAARLRALRALPRRARAQFRRLRELPVQMRELDRHLSAIDAELHRTLEELGAVRSRLDEVGSTVEGAPDRHAELRDSIHLVARRAALRRTPIRVLFLAHVLGSWDATHPLVEAMEASEDFEPVVASIPRRFRGSAGFSGEQDVHDGLTRRGVPHLRLAADGEQDLLQMVKAIEPDVIFRQSQWDADVPEEFATERLGFARTCLVPYETMNIVHNVPDPRTPNTAVDAPFHRSAWLVFCANDLMLQTAVRDGARAGAQFRVVGHPKADQLRAASPQWPLSGDGPGRPGRVVWSAHHTIARGWTDFGAFHLMQAEMLEWAAGSPGTEFVFMPHPALLPLPDAAESPISRTEFDDWMRAWSSLPNTAVLSETEYGPTLAASDLMLTDGLSMLVEYQLFGKPLLFLEREGHRPFNEIGRRVVRGVHTVHAVDEARRLADKFLSGHPDPLSRVQRRNVDELFGAGNSAQRVLAVLREEIAREAAGTRSSAS